MSTKKNLIFSFIVFGALWIVLPLSLIAAEPLSYTPLTSLPGIEAGQPVELGKYIGQIFKLIISLASIVAVLMIVVGGIQYMTSGGQSATSSAKKRIWSAVIGLLLAISSVLILQTINPNLINLDLSPKGPPSSQTTQETTNTYSYSYFSESSQSYQTKSFSTLEECSEAHQEKYLEGATTISCQIDSKNESIQVETSPTQKFEKYCYQLDNDSLTVTCGFNTVNECEIARSKLTSPTVGSCYTHEKINKTQGLQGLQDFR